MLFRLVWRDSDCYTGIRVGSIWRYNCSVVMDRFDRSG